MKNKEIHSETLCNIVDICKKNKNICLNIDMFVRLLKLASDDFTSSSKNNAKFGDLNFTPMTDQNILKTGLYAKIGECNCYCFGSIMDPGKIRISQIVNPTNNVKDWSDQIRI